MHSTSIFATAFHRRIAHVSDEDVRRSVHGFRGRGGDERLEDLVQLHDGPLHDPDVVQHLQDPVEIEDGHHGLHVTSRNMLKTLAGA